MGKNRKPTLADVARLAGVSPATVSRAISRPDLLKHGTLDRIRAVARQLGYVPDGKARALVLGRSGSIGVVVPTLDSAIFSRTLQAMQRTLSAGGYQLLVSSYDYDPIFESSVIRELISYGIDGLILVGADRPRETWDLIDSAGIPVVLTWIGTPGRDAVAVDNFRAGELIAGHLLELGHRQFGVVTAVLRTNDRQRARVAGIRHTLESEGLELAEWSVTEQPLSLVGGRAGCSALLSLAERPTAIVGGIDVLAIGVMIEAQARGLTVPDDISVAGIDNIEFAEHSEPSLTTIHIPSARIGEEAATRIMEILKNDGEPAHLMLNVELVRRRSSGPATGSA